MWEFDEEGNAINTKSREMIFAVVAVLKQGRTCGGRRENLGEFKTENDAKAFIKKFVTKLNEEGN